MAENNASIYNVENKIKLIKKDFLKLSREDIGCDVDVVFIAPPWGGIGYSKY
jgi:16S rRNA G966 N2-methylase RsmD